MSGSFESVRWNACMHRLDLGLYSYPEEFSVIVFRTRVTSNEKISSTGKKISPEEDGTHDACITQDSEPNTLPTELFRPLDFHAS